MSFEIIDTNSSLRYEKSWSLDFPYCEKCGIITGNLLGTCTGCLTGVPWNLDRISRLTDKITEDWWMGEDY